MPPSWRSVQSSPPFISLRGSGIFVIRQRGPSQLGFFKIQDICWLHHCGWQWGGWARWWRVIEGPNLAYCSSSKCQDQSSWRSSSWREISDYLDLRPVSWARLGKPISRWPDQGRPFFDLISWFVWEIRETFLFLNLYIGLDDSLFLFF